MKTLQLLNQLELMGYSAQVESSFLNLFYAMLHVNNLLTDIVNR